MDTLTVQVWKLDFSEFKSPAAKLVALAIARRGWESGSTFAKQWTIATDCGVSKQTVARCLEELEAVGWVKRDLRFRDDGGRSSDLIWLTLPEVILQATTVDRKEGRRALEMAAINDTTVDSRVTSVVGGGEPPRDTPPSRVATLSESSSYSDRSLSVREAADPLPGPDIPTAVDLIWQRASKVGRGRSSKADIEKGLRAAISRGHAMERILRGLGGYFSSPDAVKDDGAFQRGPHVMLANDRWASFLDDDQARLEAGETLTPQAQAVVDDLGTMEAPTPKRQAVWMDLYAKGMAWDPERGPQPGRAGCRVSPKLQRAAGVTPWEDQQAKPQERQVAPPEPSSDDAAFD